MVTHWESSKRPLYVRTIWRDGQHHVILDKSKENPIEASISKSPKLASPSQAPQRATRSASSASIINLNVSSLRVTFSGGVMKCRGATGRREIFRMQEPIMERPKTWTKPTVRQVTLKDFNKEINFETKKGLNMPSRYNPTDLGYFSGHMESPISNIDHTLSEKVIVWLDLAAAKGQIDGTKQNCTANIDTDNILESACESLNNLNHSTFDYSVLQNIQDRKEDLIVFNNEKKMPCEKEDNDDHFYHILTPRNNQNKSRHHENDQKMDHTAKRQLHIFMPNLPSKLSECCDSSNLSSKMSNL